MRRLTFGATLGGALAGLLVFAVMASATGQSRQDLGQTFGKGFSAQMSGTVEVPPGDPDGSGTALVRVNVAEGLLCYELKVTGVDPLVAAHIHKGAAGVAGPIVIPLVPPSQTTGQSKGCVQVDASLLQDIVANPSQYYANVHNAGFPAGALRGQLAPLNEAPIKPKVIVKTKVVHVHDCKKPKKK